jgi:hypothetical protein
MLYDPRKIVELNLIDNISGWAKARMTAWRSERTEKS